MTETTLKNVTVDCRGLDKQALYAALADALELPDWFGANFDALYDVLTDPDFALAVSLTLSGWTESSLTDQERSGFVTDFEDAADEAGEGRFTFTLV